MTYQGVITEILFSLLFSPFPFLKLAIHPGESILLEEGRQGMSRGKQAGELATTALYCRGSPMVTDSDTSTHTLTPTHTADHHRCWELRFLWKGGAPGGYARRVWKYWVESFLAHTHLHVCTQC